METQQIIDMLRTYTIIDRVPIVFDPDKSHECYLYDRHSNSEYLDFLLVMIAEPQTIRIRPFLNVTEEDITRMISIFKDVLEEM